MCNRISVEMYPVPKRNPGESRNVPTRNSKRSFFQTMRTMPFLKNRQNAFYNLLANSLKYIERILYSVYNTHNQNNFQ